MSTGDLVALKRSTKGVDDACSLFPQMCTPVHTQPSPEVANPCKPVTSFNWHRFCIASLREPLP
jgi:hypothetical protein